MNREKIQEYLQKYAQNLSEENLDALYKFTYYLVDQEREEATQELLEIPGLLLEIKATKQGLIEQDLVDWREVRKDV